MRYYNRSILRALLARISFGLALAVIIISLSILIWMAANDANVIEVFPFTLLSWVTYLFAHYIATGHIADDGNSEGGLSRLENNLRYVMTAIGIGSMIVAFPTGIIAVHQNVFEIMLVAQLLFIGGYVVGHQGLTGKPL